MHDVGCHQAAELAESLQALRLVGEEVVGQSRPKLNGASDGTTPEQLFAAAWGGCFQSALMAIAWKTGDDVSGSVVMVEVAQEPDSQGGYGLSATITVDIPAMEQKKAQELANAAHEHCPYSRATRGNIDVE